MEKDGLALEELLGRRCSATRAGGRRLFFRVGICATASGVGLLTTARAAARTTAASAVGATARTAAATAPTRGRVRSMHVVGVDDGLGGSFVGDDDAASRRLGGAAILDVPGCIWATVETFRANSGAVVEGPNLFPSEAAVVGKGVEEAGRSWGKVGRSRPPLRRPPLLGDTGG